jgi:hypothetical protein
LALWPVTSSSELIEGLDAKRGNFKNDKNPVFSYQNKNDPFYGVRDG